MMISRKDQEQRERTVLAKWAMKSADSRGREIPEEEDPHRTIFQRDRDRIIYSKAFRRLEYKTQVFVTHEGDYYRTRLTHTMEVAQIARAIARTLGANEDLAETIAMAHDIGHTPFGHSGEDALNRLMKDHGGFEHNTHGLRVVTLLERQYPDFKGLNLSWEVRESIVKHNTVYDKGFHPDYEPEKQPLVESQIVDMADSIAYGNHDLDDGLKAGIITRADLEKVELWTEALDIVQEEGKHLDERMVARQVVRHIIAMEIKDLVKASMEELESAMIDSPEKVRTHNRSVIRHSEPFQKKKNVRQKFLHDRMYNHYRTTRMQRKAARFIENLFTSYVEHPDQLPPTDQKWAEEIGSVERAVADYIAGMTDRYALDEYRRLFHPWERV